jgi:hypothetical protein
MPIRGSVAMKAMLLAGRVNQRLRVQMGRESNMVFQILTVIAIFWLGGSVFLVMFMMGRAARHRSSPEPLLRREKPAQKKNPRDAGVDPLLSIPIPKGSS